MTSYVRGFPRPSISAFSLPDPGDVHSRMSVSCTIARSMSSCNRSHGAVIHMSTGMSTLQACIRISTHLGSPFGLFPKSGQQHAEFGGRQLCRDIANQDRGHNKEEGKPLPLIAANFTHRLHRLFKCNCCNGQTEKCGSRVQRHLLEGHDSFCLQGPLEECATPRPHLRPTTLELAGVHKKQNSLLDTAWCAFHREES